jgi:hypothetical protein
MSLFHELSHAYSHIIDNKFFIRYFNPFVHPADDNGEDVNAVKMTNKAAGQLGESLGNGRYKQAKTWVTNSVTNFINNQR